jgi:hypothetical protein
MVLIVRSVETPKSPSIAARTLEVPTSRGLVGVPTSKRPQVDDVQYPRVSNRILKGASYEEVVDNEAQNLLILNEWIVKTLRYPT